MSPIIKTLGSFVERICVNYSEELIKPKYKKLKNEGDHPLFGLCYAASESFYYLAKEHVPNVQLKAAQSQILWRGSKVSHWVIVLENEEVFDITAPQFRNEIVVPYHSFKGRAFYPQRSKSCDFIINKIQDWLPLLPK